VIATVPRVRGAVGPLKERARTFFLARFRRTHMISAAPNSRSRTPAASKEAGGCCLCPPALFSQLPSRRYFRSSGWSPQCVSTLRDLPGHSSAAVTNRYLRRIGAGEAVAFAFARDRPWRASKTAPGWPHELGEELARQEVANEAGRCLLSAAASSPGKNTEPLP
jgi:hypothetical protein